MSASFLPCAGCHRLVKAVDVACPFCGATTKSARTHHHGAGEMTRVSRAAWLAVASTVAAFGTLGAACLEHHTVTEVAPAPTDEAGPSAEADAGDVPMESDAACAVGDPGPFPCGDASCNSATQYCQHFVVAVEACNGAGARQDVYDDCLLKDNSQSKYYGNGFPYPTRFAEECRDCPTCACLRQYEESQACARAASGGVRLSSNGVQICGACYGAPPARLERLTA